MQCSQPLVSVVIPCYNHENFVQDSIQSVIDQTYENIELIIIDDGSKDSSVEKIQEMVGICEQRFVRFEFRYRPNIGLSSTLNESLEWCQGKYFSAIASDDMMLPKKTEIQVDFLEQNDDIAAVFGGVQLIDEKNINLKTLVNASRHYNFEDIIMHRHDLPAPTQMIRIAIIKKIGGFDPNIFLEDWYILLKISKFGNVCYMKEVLAKYRRHDDNSSKKHKEMQQGRLDVLHIFNNEEIYREALKNIKWINAVEVFDLNKGLNNIIDIFLIDPKRTFNAITNRIFRSKQRQ